MSAERERMIDALDGRGRCIPWRRIYLVLSVVLFACLLVPVDRMTKSESDSVNWMTSMGSKTPLMSLDPSFMRLSAFGWFPVGRPEQDAPATAWAKMAQPHFLGATGYTKKIN